MDLEVEGIPELINQLDFTVRKMNTQSNQVLRKGGEVIQKSIVAHTPVGDGSNKGGHAKDNVNVSTVRTDGQTNYKHLFVGYNANSFWYMWFLEEGTYSRGNPKGIAPRKHTAAALRASQGQAQDVMRNELAEVVRGMGS